MSDMNLRPEGASERARYVLAFDTANEINIDIIAFLDGSFLYLCLRCILLQQGINLCFYIRICHGRFCLFIFQSLIVWQVTIRCIFVNHTLLVNAIYLLSTSGKHCHPKRKTQYIPKCFKLLT